MLKFCASKVHILNEKRSLFKHHFHGIRLILTDCWDAADFGN
jgi:hypothetical protein